jgi:hypothetical protein
VVEAEGNKANNNQWEISRILNWRYVYVPYFWPFFVGIFPYVGLKNRPKIYGR